MGNCSSEHQAKLFRIENFLNDPTAFRIFVKKKNKFIPGWLKVNDEEILFTRGNEASSFQFWPLAYLRRYGYTCSGIFFFESGRRCATGEGLHTFQSHQAERIFQTVQKKIKIEEYARGSRASSVVSNNRTNLLASNTNLNRIHQVQRFSSERSKSEFQRFTSSPSNSHYVACPSQTAVGTMSPTRSLNVAPPPYDVYYQRQWQEALNKRLFTTDNLPYNNAGNSMSMSMNGSLAGGKINNYQRQRVPSASSVYSVRQPNAPKNAFHQNKRPNSVVSAVEHGIYGVLNNNNKNNSTAFLPNIAHTQPKKNNGCSILPLNTTSMFESYNLNNFPMDRSLNSSFAGGSSLVSDLSTWISQQQLEGEIVNEHILSRSARKNFQQSLLQNQSRPQHTEKPSTSVLSTTIPAVIYGGENESKNLNQPQKYHSYINVDFPQNTFSSTLNGGSTKELHRTNKSRQDFLSSQPGGFVFSETTNTTRLPPRKLSISLCTPSPTTILPPSHSSPIVDDFLLRDQSVPVSNPLFYKNANNWYQHSDINTPTSSAFHSFNVANNFYTNNNSKNETSYQKARPPLSLKHNAGMSSSMITSSAKTDMAFNNLALPSTEIVEKKNGDFSYNENILDNSKKLTPNQLKSGMSPSTQNYVTLNISSRPSGEPKRENQKNGFNHDANIESVERITNGLGPKTNYTVIDFDKTKTLENIKHQQGQRDDFKVINLTKNDNLI